MHPPAGVGRIFLIGPGLYAPLSGQVSPSRPAPKNWRTVMIPLKSLKLGGFSVDPAGHLINLKNQ